MKHFRWSDNDREYGPFIFSRSTGEKSYAVILSTSNSDEDDDGSDYNFFRVTVSRSTLIIMLPAIIKPYRKKIQTTWDEQTNARLGRNWYWNTYHRRYGISLQNNHLSVYYGPQTDDSSTEKRLGIFLPWKEWRFIEKRIYDEKGQYFYTEEKFRLNKVEGTKVRIAPAPQYPEVKFQFLDFDGEAVEARTTIAEMEWHKGAGHFKWLSWFCKPNIARSLDIRFSKEIGPKKGSWTGGTVGHSIEMLKDELHEKAFKRYCDKQKLTLVGPVRLYVSFSA